MDSGQLTIFVSGENSEVSVSKDYWSLPQSGGGINTV